MDWIAFDEGLYDKQQLPPERRYVLVRTWPNDPDCTREAIAVGYMKFGAGCPDSPYFVIPSVGGCVTAWCDCLGDEAQERGVLWPPGDALWPPARALTLPPRPR